MLFRSQAHWPVISSILVAIGTLLTTHLIAKLWAALPPLYAQAAAWLAINWPILLIGAAIAGLVYLLMSFGVTADQIVGTVSGAFMALVGYIYNNIAYLWNVFASFAEFLINVFIDPTYAVQKLFYDLVMAFGGHMLTMVRSAEEFAGGFMKTILGAVNKVLEGINWLIDALNLLPGFDIKKMELFDENNVHAVSDGITGLLNKLEKPVSSKAVISIGRMQEKNLKNEFDYGYGAGAGLVNSLSGFKMPGADQSILDKWNQDATIKRVDEVGKIDDKVDISSEDLKIMRDLAEMKNIQNFVTLTPTVQVTTGDIHQDVDVDDMIRRIEDVMEQEITNSAEGVYD